MELNTIINNITYERYENATFPGRGYEKHSTRRGSEASDYDTSNRC